METFLAHTLGFYSILGDKEIISFFVMTSVVISFLELYLLPRSFPVFYESSFAFLERYFKLIEAAFDYPDITLFPRLISFFYLSHYQSYEIIS